MRIPLISGDEHDALSRSKSVHIWRAGQRKRIKRGYWRRHRTAGRLTLRTTPPGDA